MQEIRIVTQRFALLAFLVVAVLVAGLSGGRAASATADRTDVWTVVIPEAFPDDVFTWRLKADGTYEEDGRDAKTGEAIQPTYTGTWSMDAGRMVLRQNEYAYVFDGFTSGDRYIGTLTLDGKPVSHFCAAKSVTAPDLKSCKDEKVAA